jgi:hypothetical protein
MESTKIEALLDAYFEGNTNLEEEKVLRDYFNNKTVASHLVQYKPIFVGLQAAQQERSSRAFQLPVQEPKKNKILVVFRCGTFGFGFGRWDFLYFATAFDPKGKRSLGGF